MPRYDVKFSSIVFTYYQLEAADEEAAAEKAWQLANAEGLDQPQLDYVEEV